MPEAAPTPATGIILLVDDSELVRSFAKDLLSDGPYKILEAEDAVSALRISEQLGQKIDILITDLMLPGMSGLELAKRMRAVRPELRVLLVSADPGNEIAATLIPNAAFLDKNDLVESFADRVGKMLRVRG